MILCIFAGMNFLQKNLISIFNQYSSPEPLSLFLKNYFSENKNLGSRDRKALREAAYLYYRWRPYFELESNPLAIIKWCIDQKHTELPYLIQMMEDVPSTTLEYQVPTWPELSSGLKEENYLTTIQNLPDLFIRVNAKKKFDSIKKLKDNNIPVKLMDAQGYDLTILALPNGCPIDDLLNDEDYVVHDYASQLSILKSLKHIEKKPKTIWDVCSGAGGKTILTHQILNPAQMFCFDIRPQILQNLRKRTDKQKLNNIKTITHDWAKAAYVDNKGVTADLYICDVPCSGSGTWGRTPEQITALSEEGITAITNTQYKILSNVLKIAKPDNHILYITCSAFKAENESQIRQLNASHKFEIIHEETIDGSQYNSDSMYMCLLKKSKK